MNCLYYTEDNTGNDTVYTLHVYNQDASVDQSTNYRFTCYVSCRIVKLNAPQLSSYLQLQSDSFALTVSTDDSSALLIVYLFVISSMFNLASLRHDSGCWSSSNVFSSLKL